LFQRLSRNLVGETPMFSAGVFYDTGADFLIPVLNHDLGHRGTKVNSREIDVNRLLT